MVNISKHNLENVRLRGNSLATQYLRLGYSAPIYLPGPGPEPGPSPEPEPEPLIPGLEGIVGIWNAYGLTNEEMKANPIWKDLSGNGNDIELKNFGWQGESGVGMYNTDMKSFMGTPSNGAIFKSDAYTLNIYLPIGGSVTIFKYYSSGTSLNVRYEIKGLENAKLTIKEISISKDGIYDFKLDYMTGGSVYVSANNMQGTKDVTITIQLLPYAYENALVFDGVDDFGINLDFPVFTKEKGYTVMALRKLIPKSTNSDIFINKSAKYSSTGTGAFRFESNIDSTANRLTVVSFGENTNLRYPELISFQLLKQYNANSINVGNVEDGKILTIADYISNDFKPLGYATPLALYSLVILDHDSTEEERALIKNYWMKYYADMIEYDEFDPTKPAYAWTVKGKTNGDLDRDIVKELMGTGNDLQLTNFGFTDQSGYATTGENAGYLITDGVDDYARTTKATNLINKPYTLICNYENYMNKENDAGLVSTSLFFLFNRINKVGVSVYSMADNVDIPIKTVKAINTDGIVYDGYFAQTKLTSNPPTESSFWNNIAVGYYAQKYTPVAFKNLAIYPGTLTKPQCQKAYDWLQEQVAPKTDFGGISIDGAPNGVYILATDNKLYTKDKWKTEYNWAAVGVAVVSDEAKFVISPEESPSKIAWGGVGTLINSILATIETATAKTDYLGSYNTDKIIAQLGAGNAPAAEYCRGVTFKNGNKGYLPACGEWKVAYNNKAEVDVCMSLIGGTTINTSHYHWSSTQYDSTGAWAPIWTNGATYYANKADNRCVRAFAPLT